MIQAGIPATETMMSSGHTQFVMFARYVNVNEQAARKGAERLSEYIKQSGTLAASRTELGSALSWCDEDTPSHCYR